jgi:predicted phage terminase large subunit-like protein
VDQALTHPHAPDLAPTEWAIIAETFTDARKICVEGASGVLRVLKNMRLVEDEDFVYNKSLWQIIFKDGQKIHLIGADNPDAGRGLNLSGVWADEIGKWRYPYATWYEGIAPALRIGQKPRACITTTPKPINLLREWIGRTDGSVFITRGSTFDNSTNLSSAALLELQARYAGTRTGRQELYGELLDESESALWTRAIIEEGRIRPENAPPYYRVVVAIDPAVTSGESSDETGIIVAGATPDGHYYIIEDATMKGSPEAWMRKAVEMYKKHKCDRVIAETNNGGDMIEALLRQVDANVPYRKVTASRGKKVRAEPISALSEQKRLHMVGAFPELEDQLVSWEPDSDKSPDRMDAMVWAVTDLMGGSVAMRSLAAMADFCPSCRLPVIKGTRVCPRCKSAIITEAN